MKYLQRINHIRIAIVLIIITSLSACVSQWHSEHLFDKYCNEEGRVGQFIYERVALGEEFFRPIPTDEAELLRIDYRFYINDKKLLIDKEYFQKYYTFNNRERKVLSSTGPIYSVETTVVRKSDGKVLSKAVSLINMLDKTSKHFAVEGVTCPTGRDIEGFSLFNKNHRNLIEKTFFSKI
ncbi:hypothetical protein [Litorilituus lipolyticus]|uniref:Lipoprotein n=1 Tax=Litorilituus lipolyticus TaxID=2491017 RepID=A0A502KRS6_9GAMM|nr:hypothetical protein [Litorilituus lipolyticus]TPH14226.1 hypothetical protein EPA86_11915 [Litorilituus lipolyticus]